MTDSRAAALLLSTALASASACSAIFPAEGHDAWTEAYRTRELYEWLLRQRR